jgi:hypothetical protein
MNQRVMYDLLFRSVSEKKSATVFPTLAVWILAFVCFTIVAVYKDHQALVGAKRELISKLDKKDKDLALINKENKEMKIKIEKLNMGKTTKDQPNIQINVPPPTVILQERSNLPPIRTLSDAQKRGIKEFLKTIPSSVQVSIGSVYGSIDADNYAGEFFPLFVGRHLENQNLPSIRTGFSAMYTGVFVCTPTDDDSASPYRNALVDRFNSLGITAQKANGCKIPSGNIELLIGFRPEEVRPQG